MLKPWKSLAKGSSSEIDHDNVRAEQTVTFITQSTVVAATRGTHHPHEREVHPKEDNYHA